MEIQSRIILISDRDAREVFPNYEEKNRDFIHPDIIVSYKEAADILIERRVESFRIFYTIRLRENPKISEQMELSLKHAKMEQYNPSKWWKTFAGRITNKIKVINPAKKIDLLIVVENECSPYSTEPFPIVRQ